jgi:DNA-binding SARP family transcriptional activator/predicted negative regulator of RcsB-dependent stress response
MPGLVWELEVDFKILGPVEITMGSARLELGGVRQQLVVATLLLRANKVVTMDRLLEAMYGEDLPPTARAQVQTSIFSLRRTFASCADEPVIVTHSHGYVIKVESGQFDKERFEELVSAARAAREANSAELAVARYRDALRLWRGPALEGIDSALLRAAAYRLDEQRIAAAEDRIALELDLGRQHELVGELTELVGEHPLREGLRCQLMLALYRCGRSAEALQVYREARRIMVDELGVEPGKQLRLLEHAILTADPALNPRVGRATIQPAQWRAPGMLPADIGDFTGRTQQIAVIRRQLLTAAGNDGLRVVPVVVVAGRGGVGKTSLAIRAAHGVAGDFPDGQLFADLHGGGEHPADPARVLERFLRVLGVPGTLIPEGLDERAELYRTVLVGRKVLVVLDDAASESQVSPLLPGSDTTAVIVTSRRRLAGLAGAFQVDVPALDLTNSLALLARIVGQERVDAQPAAAAIVANHCGNLPLALRIAGARLSARPHWSIQQMADRLADETRRLDELRHGDLGMRPSIWLSYQGTSEQAQRLFRRLAMLDVPAFSGWLGAALLMPAEHRVLPDAQPSDVEDLLDDLVSAHLIDIADGSGVHRQYRFHDLIREFGRERLAAEEPTAERGAALERALGALLYVSDKADREYVNHPLGISDGATRWPLPDRLVKQLISDPLAWYERERATLAWGVRQAALAGLAELCWSLAFGAVTLYESRNYFDDWRETSEIALDAARKAGSVRGQAAMLYCIGSMHFVQGRLGPAHQEMTAAAQLFRDAGETLGAARVTRSMAGVELWSGRLDDAARNLEQALPIFRAGNNDYDVACTLRELGGIQLELEQPGAAIELLSESLRHCRRARLGRIEGGVLHRIGDAWLKSEDPARAIAAYQQALSIAGANGDVLAEANALRGTGSARMRLGAFGQAREALQRALDLSDGIGAGAAKARAMLELSDLAMASDDSGEAILFGQQAADAFRDMRMPLDLARALTLLGNAHAAAGDAGAANKASAEAAALRAETLGKQAGSASGTDHHRSS